MAVLSPLSRADDTVASTPDAAISSGLNFLALQQGADGSIGGKQKPAGTALAMMAFLASGHTPNVGNVGKYASNVGAAIDYLIPQLRPDGSFGGGDKPMYAQAMITLALAQAYGVDDSESRRKRIAVALTASVKLILAAQEVRKPEMYAGGWRYDVNSADSDLCLTAWNVLALRACQDVGVNVPRPAFARALKFVMKCYSAAGKGFANQPGGSADPTAMAIGRFCLQLLDPGSRLEAELAARKPATKPADDDSQDSYFATYCRTLAAFQIGEPVWHDVSPTIMDKLVKAQQPDGGWPDEAADSPRLGRIYSTSMAVLALSIPNCLLPAFQR